MFTLPLNPKIDSIQFNDFLSFCKLYRTYITDIYVTIRIPPFTEDAMGDVFDQQQAQIAFNNAMVIQTETGIPISATFNNIDVPPTEELLDAWIHYFKPLYNMGIRIVTLPHTIWMLSGKIQHNFPDLYVKNTILRNVQRPNELVELVKAGFSYINLDRDLMRDTERLLAIKEAKEYCIRKYDRDIKVSILANEGCWGNCPVQDEHFQYNTARHKFDQPTYFMTPLSKYSCPKWENEDPAFELKKANIPPWREDWDELHIKYGIDVFKLHGREHIPRMFESMDIIRKYAEKAPILFNNFDEYLEEHNLQDAPINIWRNKIKNCKFDCWKCNYCEKVVDNRFKSKFQELIDQSLLNALKEESKVSTKDLSVKGLSSNKVKHFLNNLCSWSGSVYAEIGSYQGSTLVAALSNNNIKALSIDNWSTPEIAPARNMPFEVVNNPKDLFYKNTQNFNNIEVLDSAIEEIGDEDVKLKKINIFFYDGDHSKNSHITAFKNLHNSLDNMFIAIIDDYNWKEVQEGMIEISKKYTVLYKKEIFTTGEDPEDFWNGLGIFILQKKY